MNKFNIIKIPTLDSTNEYLLSLKDSDIFSEGLVIITDYQFHGKGQFNNKWLSNKGENLLVSVLLEPNININYQYDICKIASLAIVDLLSSMGINSKIKWPNDILVNNNKISGILIHNIIKNNNINYSIIGFGINVNQLHFDNFYINPTSISIELKKQFKINLILDNLLSHLKRNNLVRNRTLTNKKYEDNLYRKDIVSEYENQGVKFKGTIVGVNDLGLLLVRKNDDKIVEFNLKEIKMIP